MIEPESVLLETLTRVTPLGIRFRDVATGAIVADGLDVRVRPAGVPERWTPASPTRGGAFAAAGLPGLRELELGDGNRMYWDELVPSGRRPFVVAVTDRLRRYLPLTIALDLPLKGLALPACVAPDRHGTAVPLYSAPSRPPVPGMAAIRVELQDVDRGAPVSWARVELTLGGEAAVGVADGEGAALVLAPWPRIANGASGALAAARWPVEIEAFSSGDLPPDPPPDLCAVLDQPAVDLFRDRAGTEPFAPTDEERLRFGRELVLAGESGKVFVRPSA